MNEVYAEKDSHFLESQPNHLENHLTITSFSQKSCNPITSAL